MHIADTGWKLPTAHSDDHSDWNNPQKAMVDDENYAEAWDDDYDQDWYDFDFGVPVGATINGIHVEIDADNVYTGTPQPIICSLSWDGGASDSSTESETIDDRNLYYYGGAADTWDRGWSASEFSNANFRVKLRMHETVDILALYYIKVKVFYTEAPTFPVGMEVNIGDAWKAVTKVEINVGDVWKEVTMVEVNVGDVWKEVTS